MCTSPTTVGSAEDSTLDNLPGTMQDRGRRPEGGPSRRDDRPDLGLRGVSGALHLGDGPGHRLGDLAGHLLLPAAVEPHAHLDKAFLAEREENETGDLLGAIDAMIRLSGRITHDDIVERAERAARLMASNGYVAVRTHADTTVYNGVTNVVALAEVRRRVADVIDIEIVALVGIPVLGPPR